MINQLTEKMIPLVQDRVVEKLNCASNILPGVKGDSLACIWLVKSLTKMLVLYAEPQSSVIM